MLNSRTHAALDVGIAAGLGALALAPATSTGVRRIAAAAAVAQAGQMAVTNYDAGLRPVLSFGRHRQIDLLGGAALGLAGAALGSKALFALAAATVGSALFSEVHAHDAPSTLYRPLDVPKPFGPDLWLVDSEMGPGLPVRMTVIRLEDGGLLLHSPTRFSAGLRHALEAIGPIRHLVAPNSVHWTFVKPWQDAVPDARVYAAPGLRERGQVKRSGLLVDEVLSDVAPAAWGGAIEQVVVPGGAGFREVVMFHAPSRTVLMTDLVQNFEARKLPWVLRPLGWLLGNTSPASKAPAHLRAVVRLATGAAAAARRVVAWRPERILMTHGTPITTGATERLRASLGWLTAR